MGVPKFFFNFSQNKQVHFPSIFNPSLNSRCATATGAIVQSHSNPNKKGWLSQYNANKIK